MPTAMLVGIEIYYETYGSGMPILMCAPGGFDATIDKWRVANAWAGIDALKALAAEHTMSSTIGASAASPADVSNG